MAAQPPSALGLAMPPLMSVALLMLGAYVAFELSRRVRERGPEQRNLWLAASAVALACGLWGALVVALGERFSPIDAGIEPGLAITMAVAALALCLLALHWTLSPQPPGWAQVAAGAGLFGLAAAATQLGLLQAVGVQPGIPWSAGRTLLAALAAGIGFGAALVAFLPVSEGTAFRLRPRQLAGAGLAALGALAGMVLLMPGAAAPLQPVQADASLIAAGTMSGATATGSIELLLLMLLGCLVEARLRGANGTPRPEAAAAEAFRDPLTRLPTRSTFEGTLAQVLHQAETHKAGAALLHIALDGFKSINDNHGHSSGDNVLKSMAQRLRALAPPHRVARMGGDEFLMLIDGDDPLQLAKTKAAEVLEAVARPCPADGREHSITASIGVAVFPQHGSLSVLISHASIATRASKSAGGATYSLFDSRMVDTVREQSELLRDLRQALSLGQLELYYQPKIHAPSAQVGAAEALLRWHHPQRGMISPGVFIPIAERSGLILALGTWVIDEACRQARAWRDEGLRMRVAINLSVHQLRQADLAAHIGAALAKHQINPDLLTCEITESVAMEDTEATVRVFTELAAVGVHISIDDFGSGYSSLGYLRKLPANELKIDRSFVLDLETSEEARKIAEAVVGLAQALNMKVVAEGVETDAQYQILRRMGCEHVQGFLFAKPMSAKALALWAMGSDGPRSIQFRESLFKETATLEA
jgi:diguanylate cyclase (GGDEF)-like protein